MSRLAYCLQDVWDFVERIAREASGQTPPHTSLDAAGHWYAAGIALPILLSVSDLHTLDDARKDRILEENLPRARELAEWLGEAATGRPSPGTDAEREDTEGMDIPMLHNSLVRAFRLGRPLL